MVPSFRAAVESARRHDHLYFAALLSQEQILNIFGSAASLLSGWIYPPAVTVWVFLSQCLSMDHSCRDAVSRLIAWRIAGGLGACSAETGAFCTARSHLPEEACQELVRQTGQELEAQAPADWLWNGRRVRVVDGTTVTMADTAENQAEYPQVKGQQPGCGFPIARLVVVFSLAVGTVLEASLGKYAGKQTGENSMFRELHDCLTEGDVVLADRYFSGWCDSALLMQRGVDVVVRKHQLRATDFRTGVRLGKDDHLVSVKGPKRPKWMSPEEYATLPAELVLREVRVRVTRRGFRTKELTVVTTLTDAEQYPAAEIAELYRRRWEAELNLRSLKIVLQMDQLRCKVPARVRNEMRMHLLGYNLIRRMMSLAALRRGVCPWEVSFKGALQTFNNFLPILGSRVLTEVWLDALLDAIGTHLVYDRPDRYEPRLTKRRPKKYKHLRKPRKDYRKQMA